MAGGSAPCKTQGSSKGAATKILKKGGYYNALAKKINKSRTGSYQKMVRWNIKRIQENQEGTEKIPQLFLGWHIYNSIVSQSPALARAADSARAAIIKAEATAPDWGRVK